jgi:hypothetical protein
VDIRTAHVDDAAAIATVHVESWRTTYKGIVPDDFLARLSYERRGQLWRQVLTEPGSASFVYVADDGPGQSLGSSQAGRSAAGIPSTRANSMPFTSLRPTKGKASVGNW